MQYVLNGRERDLPLQVPPVRRVLPLPAYPSRLPVVGPALALRELVLDPHDLQHRSPYHRPVAPRIGQL